MPFLLHRLLKANCLYCNLLEFDGVVLLDNTKGWVVASPQEEKLLMAQNLKEKLKKLLVARPPYNSCNKLSQRGLLIKWKPIFSFNIFFPVTTQLCGKKCNPVPISKLVRTN